MILKVCSREGELTMALSVHMQASNMTGNQALYFVSDLLTIVAGNISFGMIIV
jgi:hypothetical protein